MFGMVSEAAFQQAVAVFLNRMTAAEGGRDRVFMTIWMADDTNQERGQTVSLL